MNKNKFKNNNLCIIDYVIVYFHINGRALGNSVILKPQMKYTDQSTERIVK